MCQRWVGSNPSQVFGFPKPLSFTVLLPLDAHISISSSSTDFYIPRIYVYLLQKNLKGPGGGSHAWVPQSGWGQFGGPSQGY